MDGDFSRMFLFSSAVSSLADLLSILLCLTDLLGNLDVEGRGKDKPLLEVGPTLKPLLGLGLGYPTSLLLLIKSLYLLGLGELIHLEYELVEDPPPPP